MDLREFQIQNKFLMLALDHRGSFKKYVNKNNPESAKYEDVVSTKAAIIGAANETVSGMLLDPDFGVPAYKKSGADKPYLICLEKTGYQETSGERFTELQYTAEELKKQGASGAKILVYFNPAAKNCAAQIETSRKALEDANKRNLPLFLEIVTYGNEELNKSRGEWILKSLKMFLKADVLPNVWKLEYPGDAEGCKKITELVGKTPWILLTRGERYDVFKNQLKDAISNGAGGFLAGRAVWQEIGDYDEMEQKRKFADETVKKRFKELADIALK
ncbi:MAG: DUF2090 domain-containing protein [Patescibacteria group bacterium]|nr:DUF2090 domain-containing protein [Patescibacteria group bacterium]